MDDSAASRSADVERDLAKLTPLQTLSSLATSQPISLSQLAVLTSLSLKGTGLSEVPSALSSLTGLEDLDLSSNSLSTLPSFINKLSSLRWAQALLPYPACSALGKTELGVDLLDTSISKTACSADSST